jgi:hypothetical protein
MNAVVAVRVAWFAVQRCLVRCPHEARCDYHKYETLSLRDQKIILFCRSQTSLRLLSRSLGIAGPVMKLRESTDLARQMVRTTTLSVLGEVAESEKENYIPSPSVNGRGRKLTIQQEVRLIQNLAFLASYTDDPYKVMAVCVEETKKQDELILRIASNQSDMSHVVDGFSKITKLLKVASRRGWSSPPLDVMVAQLNS